MIEPRRLIHETVQYKKKGQIKSIYQVYERKIEKEKGKFYILKWCAFMGITICTILLLILFSAVGLMYTLKHERQAFYNENCTTRTCINNLNLKCINKICLCEKDYFYTNKCNLKKNYNEKCHFTSYCKDNSNLICKDGVCKCNEHEYWNGKSCVNKLTYGQECKNDSECLTQTFLYCDSTNKCSCNITRFWDGTACYPKKTINENCKMTSNCKENEYLICKNGFCNCNSTQYWDINLLKCLNKAYENETCTQNIQCYTPMNCTSNKICQCDDKHYHNLTSLTCDAKKIFNEQCIVDFNCRVDKYLECKNGICQCITSFPLWSDGYNKCIVPISYSGLCYDTTDCDPTKSLYCNDASYNCTCPLNLAIGQCDCIREFNNEYYWDGNKCVIAVGYTGSCINSSTTYMCKTLTEGTICSGPSPYKCKCPSLQYYNYANNKCENQLLNILSCTQSDACRSDLGLSCQLGLCQCNSTYQFWNGSKCISYYTYDTETCNYDNECKGDLICQTTVLNTCNCPRTVVANKCDCPKRVSGIEYYWNGNECTPSLTYNSNCTNSSTNYMCKTLSEGTSCIGPIFKCTCLNQTYTYYNYVTRKCESKLLFNVSCVGDLSCRSDLGLYCDDLTETCQCNSTIPLWTGSKCSDFFTYNNQICTSNYQCKSPLVCRTSMATSCKCPNSFVNKCDCPTPTFGNEYYWNGTSCSPAASYNQNCHTGDYTCKTITQGTVCDTSIGKCVCDTNYFWNSTYCVTCKPNWHYLRGSCFRGSTSYDNSGYFFDTLTAAKIIQYCYNEPTAKIATLYNADLSSGVFTTSNFVASPNEFYAYTPNNPGGDCPMIEPGSPATYKRHDCTHDQHDFICEIKL